MPAPVGWGGVIGGRKRRRSRVLLHLLSVFFLDLLHGLRRRLLAGTLDGKRARLPGEGRRLDFLERERDGTGDVRRTVHGGGLADRLRARELCVHIRSLPLGCCPQ